MNELLLSPPIAFVIYLLLVGLLTGMGYMLAGHHRTNWLHSMTYAGGEAGPSKAGAPGYQSFFSIALFFAVLHLGALILGGAVASPALLIYIGGLALVLLTLILG
jgi:NADH:ubiquinone oxidoreductase subunit 3 (subunit A)